MANFNIAYALTIKIEAGYANHPDDKGGETFAGIARNFHPDWPGWKTVDAIKTGKSVKQIDTILFADSRLMLQVRQFYKQFFWDENRLDAVINQEIANELFDTGVNLGTDKTALILQEAVNMLSVNGKRYKRVTVDGVVGNQTINTLNGHAEPNLVYKMLNGLQLEHYIKRMRADPDQEVFARGWLSRVDFKDVV